MPLVLDKKRHPVQIGWRELLFGTKRLKGQKGTKNKKTKDKSSATPPDNTTEPAKVSIGTAKGWTQIDDAALLGMKAQNKTWKEISEAMPDKGLTDMKQRYKELYDLADDTAKGHMGGDVDDFEGEKKGKGIGKGEEKAGILKTGNGKGKEGGGSKEKGGRPVIFADSDEELTQDELIFLCGLYAKYDEKKWIEIASRFFDKTGKRIDIEMLKKKLGPMALKGEI